MATGERKPHTVWVTDEIWHMFTAMILVFSGGRPDSTGFEIAINAALLHFATLSRDQAEAFVDRFRELELHTEPAEAAPAPT